MANDPRLDVSHICFPSSTCSSIHCTKRSCIHTDLVPQELHQLTKAALVKRLRQQEQDRKEERQNYVTFLRMLGIIIAILLSVGIYVMCFSSGRNGQDVSLGGDAKIAKGVVTMDVMMYDERDRIAMIRRKSHPLAFFLSFSLPPTSWSGKVLSSSIEFWPFFPFPPFFFF